MEHLDDLPKRDNNHETQEIAETAFRTAISESKCFVIQQEDRRDYGTDFQLEVTNNGKMTNTRVHVQLKGTKSSGTSNGAVSRRVCRKNINYLLQQPCSIYVCYHQPTKRLLFRYAEDIYREYEHRGGYWHSQKSITVSFTQLFDTDFQNSLKIRSSAIARSSRNERVTFAGSPPEQLSKLIKKTTEKVIVPTGIEPARAMLNALYDAGRDAVISNSFEQFLAELSSQPPDMMMAYMAEINLGINGMEFNENRVREGIEEINKLIDLELFEVGSLLYTIGNGWLALKKYERARNVYDVALTELDRPGLSDLAAQCYKNMGTALEHLSDDENIAITFYQRALELAPRLSEAHFALALCYRRKQDFSRFMEHLDQVVFLNRSDGHNLSLQGWRIEALFYNADSSGAFREINSLVFHADKSNWIWPWCARQVANFGRDSLQSARKAVDFWNLFLQEHSGELIVKQERLRCLWCMKSYGEETDVSFDSFREQALELMGCRESDIAFWWDRIGHWAQFEKNWVEAKACYRKAYDLDPKRYGYCLGTALNFIGEYKEAYQILLEQAEYHYPDAMSWFQVAVACEGIEDNAGSLFAYHKAIKLNPEYDLAWFNLGGIYLNLGSEENAMEIWREAIDRFPDHELVEELYQKFPILLGYS